ncbi:MAG TPA: glutathione S-transferase family protein [Burkholderiaceae bacterium]|jgi:glutathione S-transferase|nr:glutathione S-transferase family protein [Burkholderiaceae bacterium]
MTQQDTKLRVLGRYTSSNVQKVLWCLGELRQPFQREDYGGPFGRTNDPEYLRFNPNGTVPTLVDGNLVIWESNTIVRYLCNKFPKSPLYPADAVQRALAERWMDWQLGSVAVQFLPLYRGLVREQRRAEELEAARQRTASLLAVLDAALAQREYLNGPELTVADIALGPTVYRWYELPISRESMPNLQGWYERLSHRPAFRDSVMVGLH